MSRAVVTMAPAKINLTLEVLGRRPDGYHEIASVFATVGLWDRVRVAPAGRLDVRIAPPLALHGGDDLAALAVRALADACGRPPAAYVRVRKRIPVAAGLGGGSSDAGAVLRGLARAWRREGMDLAAVGARVGSDVPFFASAAAWALVRGRGERLEPLPAPAETIWIVLVRLAVGVRTADVFRAHRAAASRGERSAALAAMLREGRATAEAMRGHLANDLLDAAERVAPAIARARATAAALGTELTLSGSGPSLFALADDRASALRIGRRLRRGGLRARAFALGVSP